MRLAPALLLILSGACIQAAEEPKPAPELAACAEKPRHRLPLSAEASLELEVDSALMSILIRCEDPELAEALRLNNALRDNLVKNLLEKGLAREALSYGKFPEATPQNAYRNAKDEPHCVENILRICVRDEAQLGLVAAETGRYEQVHFLGIEAQAKKLPEGDGQSEVLRRALEQLNHKKKLYEQALGIQLKLLNLSEGPLQLSSPNRAEHFVREAPSALRNVLLRQEQKPSTEGFHPGLFGKIVYQLKISAEYELP